MMKRILLLLIFSVGLLTQVQSQNGLLEHYKEYYKQMRLQGDVRGAINALTHLNILSPDKAQKDTLAYLYANSGQYLQAVNVLGADKDPADSDLAVRIKAISLKSLNQPQLAVQHYEVLYTRKPGAHIAYELADLNLQIGKADEATKYITYGLTNAKEEDKIAFYESNPPYEVPLKAAFTYINGLLMYNKDKTKIDEAIEAINKSITMAPNFTLAKQIGEALLKQKQQQAAAPKQ